MYVSFDDYFSIFGLHSKEIFYIRAVPSFRITRKLEIWVLHKIDSSKMYSFLILHLYNKVVTLPPLLHKKNERNLVERG
jgi:hypothetical protein